MLELVNKDFKMTIINTLKNPQEKMEWVRNREFQEIHMKTIRNNQMLILKLNIITEIKNLLIGWD